MPPQPPAAEGMSEAGIHVFLFPLLLLLGQQGERELEEEMLRKRKGKRMGRKQGEERGFEKPGSFWHLRAAQ